MRISFAAGKLKNAGRNVGKKVAFPLISPQDMRQCIPVHHSSFLHCAMFLAIQMVDVSKVGID